MDDASEGSPSRGQPVPRGNLKGGGVFGEKFEPPEAPRHRSPELLGGGDEKSKNPKIQKSEKSKNPLAKMPALETRLLAGFEIRGCFISIFIQ